MLCLTRQKNESVYLEIPGVGTVEIKINKLTGSRVQVGIEAPKEIFIHRGSPNATD